MNTDTARKKKDDSMLTWTMRIVGFALAVMSIVFLTNDIVHGANATLFFSISAGLGVVTLILSWMPQNGEAKLADVRAAKYASTVN